MAIGLICLGSPTLAEEVVIARFETATERLPITVEDMADAAPLFGDQGAGLALELSPEAGAAFADMTERTAGTTLSFYVCDTLLVSAVIQGRLSGRGQVAMESLGEATYYARVLNGEISC